MKIIAEEDKRPGESATRGAAVRYDTDTRERCRITLTLEWEHGTRFGDVRLTHQEARALGHALLTDAARAQKELEG